MIVNQTPEHENLKLNVPLLPIIILLVVIVLGTLGFYYLWNDSNGTWIDSLYMVMITITTIGYGEVHELSGGGQIFTMVIAVFGIASLFYIFTSVMESLVLAQIYNIRGKKKLKRKIYKMENHYIIVGYGRVGKIVTEDLISKGLPFVVIDNEFVDAQKEMNDKLFKGMLGDASEDQVLIDAGIHNAKSLIVTIGSPAVSTFVVLTARELNRDLYIIARGDNIVLDSKLYKAGANKVINPYETGGKKLANFAVNPNISDFMESNFNAGDKTLRIERFSLPSKSEFIGQSLVEIDIRRKFGVTIIGIIRNGMAELNPSSDFQIESEDEFVAIGSTQQINQLNDFITTSRTVI